MDKALQSLIIYMLVIKSKQVEYCLIHIEADVSF